MTLVRERRHQEALKLSLPPTMPAAEFRRHRSPLSALSPLTLAADSPPGIESLNDLEKLAVLGHGSGGTVYKVRHKKTTSIFALKVLRFIDADLSIIPVRAHAARETEILQRVDSEYVVRCHGVFDVNGSGGGGGGGDDLSFVMEYMEAGSLHDVLQVRRRLPEKVISGIAKRVLEGLKYLHGMHIVHGDIKPSNLLINYNGDIKIADFGVSRVVDHKHEEYETFTAGTCAYMSPERFDPERWGGGGCDDYSDGFAGDVWSLGLAVLECHVGHFPLIGPGQKPDWATLMCAICFGDRQQMEMIMPETASPEFRNFVQRCLEKDWRKRGSVAELLNHPFINKCSSCGSTLEVLVSKTSNC